MNDNKEIPVVFATDLNYVPILLVALKSLYNNTKYPKEIRVYVLTEEYQSVREKIINEFENEEITIIDMAPYVTKINFSTTNRFSRSAYYRIFIPRLLSKYEKIIYLDCDIICLGDVVELFDESLNGQAVGCICDKVMLQNFGDYLKKKNISDSYYFNSGVMVFDTKRFIENRIEQKCEIFITGEERYAFPDQDILNLACKDAVFDLDESWNYQWHRQFGWLVSKYRYQERLPLKDINILHYTSEFKPWVLKSIKLSKPWWKYYDTLSTSSKMLVDDFRKRERSKFISVLINRVKLKINKLR